MKVNQIIRNVFQVSFDTQESLCMTLLRFAEFYQSPEFKGKIFSLEDYKTWYIANSPEGKKKGRFTYCEDWEGFTVPSWVLNPFYDGKFPNVNQNEKNLLQFFDCLREEDYCIIGTSSETQNGVEEHELSHGLYNVCSEYKKKVDEVLTKMDTSKKKEIVNFFFSKSPGYHKSSWNEEMHAYLIDSLYDLANKGVNIKPLFGEKDILKRLFYEYLRINRAYPEI